MTYEQSLDFIHGIPRFGKKPGLERVRELLQRMGNPQDSLSFIHVAGTNGKGSTCAMLSFILREAGYRTGLYISPFVIDFRERIQIDGQMIPKDTLAEIATEVRSHWLIMQDEGEPPSEFEVVVAIAFEYFKRQKCDIIVLEVGMGGRLDSTNVISASLVSVITSIGLDHMEYLGNTIDKIAAEKCGILKRGGVCVSAPEQEPLAMDVIRRRCAEAENPLFVPDEAEVLSMGIEGSRMRYRDMEIHVPLTGPHQIKNALTAVEVCKALELTSYNVRDTHIINGIAKTSFPCRMERFGGRPLIVIDGAHNEPGARALAEALGFIRGRRIHAVMGISPDKDARSIMKLVLPLCSSVVISAAQGVKASSPEELEAVAKKYSENITCISNSEEALRLGLSKCVGDDILLVFGSLYFASEARAVVCSLGFENI